MGRGNKVYAPYLPTMEMAATLRCGKPPRLWVRPNTGSCFLWRTSAITFSSTAIGVGKALTPTVVRVGRVAEKYSAYTSLYAGKSSSMFVRNTVTSTTDTTTGVVTFLPGHIPAAGAFVRAGFTFDVPVRFDTDYLEVDLAAFAAGSVPRIPLVEIRL